MKNTDTKTARSIVRNILAKNNIKFSKQTYTNKCADSELRNLCFIVDAMSESVLQQLQQALQVSKIHTTRAFIAYGFSTSAYYLRVVHCSK